MRSGLGFMQWLSYARSRLSMISGRGLASVKAPGAVMTTSILRRLAFFCALLIAGVLLVDAPLAQEHAGPHWTYSGSNGPDHWGELDKTFSSCQQGHLQSPIDIRAPKPADLPQIRFAYQPTPLHIVNNGHTIQINYAPGSFITVSDKRYQLTQFNFHHPSEERVD